MTQNHTHPDPLHRREAQRRLALDHDLLDAAVTAASVEALDRPFRVSGGPLGDFCETLHDLVAHVLMWDEIDLAVLTEARAGRAHWSLDPRWEDAATGQALNRGGVSAGRHISADLLLHRLSTTREALLGELASVTDEEWSRPSLVERAPAASLGGLVEYVMTVPNTAPYWHAAVHLGQLAAVVGAERS